MELVKPDLGLVFWMIVSFSIVLFILKKYAWGPTLASIKERENKINEALKDAENQKKERELLNKKNEELNQQNKIERDIIIKEAREMKDKIIKEAEQRAKEEANRIIENAKLTIQNEKMAALIELRNEIALLSIEITEKLLNREMEDKDKQKQYIEQMLQNIKIN